MFDDRLKKLRLARGLSQQDVAEALGLKVNTYRNYENNDREPNSTVLIKLGAYFGVTLDYLLDYHCDNKKSPPPENKWEALEQHLNTLSDAELIEIEEYLEFLSWKKQRQKSQEKQG